MIINTAPVFISIITILPLFNIIEHFSSLVQYSDHSTISSNLNVNKINIFEYRISALNL